MKPPVLLLLFISSFGALAALPYSIELAVSPIALTGLLVVMSADYGRRVRSLTEPVRRAKTPEWFRLAA